VLARVCGYDVHRGVLAAADRPAPRTADEVIAGVGTVLVAEAVNDNENIGSLFRNAAALGVGAVLLDPACADPLYRRSIRVSSGWSMRLPHARVPDTAAALGALARAGVRTVALTPQPDALAVHDAAGSGVLAEPLALVVGAEGPGLSPATLASCDATVRVPMAPGVDSLNVATSFAVVAAFAAAARNAD
jgi:tRNA G18 (ribose-2'-O)-methylase SpoU